MINSFYNLYTNLNGNYCSLLKEEQGKSKETNCPNSFSLQISLANKLKYLTIYLYIYKSNEKEIEISTILNFISLFVIMGVLLYFRKS
jgi:hypothetical protein